MKEGIEKFLYTIILVLWVVLGLYFGVADYTILKIEESKALAEISKIDEKVSGPDGLSFKISTTLKHLNKKLGLHQSSPILIIFLT